MFLCTAQNIGLQCLVFIEKNYSFKKVCNLQFYQLTMSEEVCLYVIILEVIVT